VHDWQRLLGADYPAWASLLARADDPLGLRFLADFGTGEGEFELTRDDAGFFAIPTEGATPQRLNVTEAEFARIDLIEVLRRVATAAAVEGPVESITTRGSYLLGRRSVSGTSIALLAAPLGLESIKDNERRLIAPRALGADVALLLVPDEVRTSAAARAEFSAMKVALAELPRADPWRADWSPLVVEERFELLLADPVFFFGARCAVIVDTTQQRIWLEGRELKVKADGQSYRLFEHLAERPMTGVPVSVLANKVLEVDSDRLESKIVSDAKHELMKAIRNCLTPAPDAARIVASTLVTLEDGRAMLNVEPALVRVIRRLSER
jgi:hypothetical protein